MTSLTLDNIFKAVTDDCVESYELQLRSDLLIVLRDVMYDRGWQQKEAAEHMRLTQQGILNLKAGKLENFPIALLVNCLFNVGYRFKPTYKNGQLKITVETVQ